MTRFSRWGQRRLEAIKSPAQGWVARLSIGYRFYKPRNSEAPKRLARMPQPSSGNGSTENGSGIILLSATDAVPDSASEAGCHCF